MVDNEKERKELMEAIRLVLLSTEKCKTAITPLVRDQEDVFKILKSHEEAITSLMDKLIGTKQYHEERLKALDLMKTSVSELEEKQEAHESLHKLLEKRLKRLELEQISQILVKMDQRQRISVDDLEVVEEVLSLYPDDTDLISIKSQVLNTLGRKEEALEYLEEAISKYPNGARLWFVRGLLLEDFDEQLKSFDKAIELLKEAPPINQHIVVHSRAALFASAGRFEEALDSSIKSLELNQFCYIGWVLKGKILVELARIPEALGSFDKATELDKNRKEAWFEKGNALFVLGPKYYDEGMICYDKAIELDPNFVEAYFNKAKLLTAKAEDEKAIQIIDAGLEINDKNPCAWCDRGAALNRIGRNEEAIESLKRALELGPPKECNQIFLNMATVLYYLERHKEGVEFAKRIVEAEPKNVRFWDVLACHLQALGRDEEALKAFEKALSLRKSDEEISWDDLAKLYERMGREKEAEQAYQKYESIKKEATQANNVDQ